jgi:hypothetical protein
MITNARGYLRAVPWKERADEAFENFPIIHVFHRLLLFSFSRGSATSGS